MQFKDRLKELRKERGITQVDLAVAVGLERSSIGKYEGKGCIMPSDEVKAKIADYFNVSIDYLLGRTDVRSFVGAQQKQPTAEGDELRKEIVSLLEELHDLSDQEVQMVRDFVAMLKGHRGAAAAHPHPGRPE